jgi:hypothetical protein
MDRGQCLANNTGMTLNEFKDLFRKLANTDNALIDLGLTLETIDGGDVLVVTITATDVDATTITATGVITGGSVVATTATITTLDAGDINFTGDIDGGATSDIYARDYHVDGTLKVDTIDGRLLSTTTVNNNLDVQGNITFTGNIDGGATSDLFVQDARVEGVFNHVGSQLSFFNGFNASLQTITGSRGGNAALADLLTSLAAYNLIIDNTSA